jgi:hypothetical protein
MSHTCSLFSRLFSSEGSVLLICYIPCYVVLQLQECLLVYEQPLICPTAYGLHDSNALDTRGSAGASMCVYVSVYG